MNRVIAADRVSLWLRLQVISTVVFAALVALCAAEDAWASLPLDGLMVVNHVRFACAFTDQTFGPKLEERQFRDMALFALNELAEGHLEPKVATQTAWSRISDPEAAMRDCRSRVQGRPLMAGDCERSSYALMLPDRPLVISNEPLLDAISLNDEFGVVVVIGGHRLIGGAIDISLTIIEPSNHFVSEQRIKTFKANFPSDAMAPREELQLLFTKYFSPWVMNRIKGNDFQLNSP